MSDLLCKHRPLTVRHLSISWCSSCQDWQLRWSQSGRRDESGGVVLIEHLRSEMLESTGDDPYVLTMWLQRELMSVIELEDDRRNYDELLRSAAHNDH